MSRPIETSRNSCALHGAIQTLQSIEGVVPIIHSTTGCGLQQYLGGSRVSGCNGSGYCGGLATPSTNVLEKQIIFGGTSRLREQIKNTVKVIQGELYVVLTGCATELVGDDALAMTKEAQEQGFPVIYINTPGFRGDVYSGYEVVVKGLIEQLPKSIKSNEKISGMVNILGIVPNQDVFWQGNLQELRIILETVNLQVNTLFGFGQGIQAWQQIQNAELNLVFSPWGLEVAKLLEEKYGTPYFDFYSLPVGAGDTNVMLEVLSEKLNLNRSQITEVQQLQKKQLNYYLEKIADVYFDSGLQKEFAIVGEASFILGLCSFLSKTVGLIPKTLIVTDNPAETYRRIFNEEINNLVEDLNVEIAYAEDAGKINDIIRKSNAELILGSSLEKEIARQLDIPLLKISFPLTDQVVLGKSYIGYSGAIALLEDLSTNIISWQNQLNLKIIQALD